MSTPELLLYVLVKVSESSDIRAIPKVQKIRKVKPELLRLQIHYDNDLTGGRSAAFNAG